MWVTEIAQKLDAAGIAVIFDEWDIGPGSDLVKFMEMSVSRAERVLMICSEAYVRKVDEGKGGAGYEAMIVTGELIRDLGTDKFIPVLRQKDRGNAVPRCLSSRVWVNLSEGSDVEPEFNKLVAELRREPPPTKPPRRDSLRIESNPDSPGEKPAPNPAVIGFPQDAAEAYAQAFQLARAGDVATWRKSVERERAGAAVRLSNWRASLQSLPQNTDQLPDYVTDGLASHQVLFAAALAGIESAQPKFNSQSGLLYDLVAPKGWNGGSYPVITGFPDTVGFVFQAIAGAMYVYTDQIPSAIELATQRIASRYDPSKSSPLFLQHALVGWPESLGHDCTMAWGYLLQLPSRFSWLVEAFGSAETYHASLCGYYLLLSWLEFLDYLKQGRNDAEIKDLRVDVPPLFLSCSEHVDGQRRLMASRELLRQVALRSGTDQQRQVAVWPNWSQCLMRFVGGAYRNGFFSLHRSEIEHFASDIYR